MAGTGWREQDVPDVAGHVYVVTGANSGIGLEAARVLAERGAAVVLACRRPEPAQAAVERIRRTAPDAALEVQPLDLADLSSVRAAADALVDRHPRIDGLVNNAGIMAPPLGRTADGFETQLGVNHLGHFALTLRLLPLLLRTPGSRIASMSSMGHRGARGPFDPLGERRYDRWQAYFHSKLANLLFTAELQRLLAAAGASTVAVAAHPGASGTDLGTEGSSLTNAAMRMVVPLITQSAAAGARPMLRALTDPGVRGGEFYGPRFLVRGATPVRERPSRAARDDAAARRLWDVSADLSGVRDSLGRRDPAGAQGDEQHGAQGDPVPDERVDGVLRDPAQ